MAIQLRLSKVIIRCVFIILLFLWRINFNTLKNVIYMKKKNHLIFSFQYCHVLVKWMLSSTSTCQRIYRKSYYWYIGASDRIVAYDILIYNETVFYVLCSHAYNVSTSVIWIYSGLTLSRAHTFSFSLCITDDNKYNATHMVYSVQCCCCCCRRRCCCYIHMHTACTPISVCIYTSRLYLQIVHKYTRLRPCIYHILYLYTSFFSHVLVCAVATFSVRIEIIPVDHVIRFI